MFGAKRVVLASLVVWTGVVAYAFFLPAGDVVRFFVLAFGIGLVLGGSQALSRSLFSQMIPRGKEAEYFGLYEISERGTSWLGHAAVRPGAAAHRQLPGRDHLAGGVLRPRVRPAARVDVRRAISEAGNEVPARV